jgi:hypothetical protein
MDLDRKLERIFFAGTILEGTHARNRVASNIDPDKLAALPDGELGEIRWLRQEDDNGALGVIEGGQFDGCHIIYDWSIEDEDPVILLDDGTGSFNVAEVPVPVVAQTDEAEFTKFVLATLHAVIMPTNEQFLFNVKLDRALREMVL